MSKEIFISSTPHETRLAIVENEALSEIYYERENEYTLAGSIYKGKVTRVLPGMQSAFVDIGLERDAFLYITDFLEETPDSEEFETEGSATPVENGAGSGDQRERGGRRRGRGRRGRDRGERGGEQQGGQEAVPTGETLVLEGGFGEEETIEITGSADQGEVEERPAEDQGEGGSRRWRGRRGRRRGRGRREESQTLSGEPRSEYESDPVEFEPEAHPAEQPEPTAQVAADLEAPFILPGESLSKYRRGEEAAAAAVEEKPVPAAPVISGVAKPATLVEVIDTTGWDGGFALPGESLSRRRSAPQAAAPVVPVAAVVEEVPVVAEQPAEVLGTATDLEFAPAAAEAQEVAQADPVEEAAAVEQKSEEPVTPAEYEPTEGSVSFRVDAGQSEFRQKAEPEFEEEVMVEEAAAEENSAVEHAFTTLQPTGEMISEVETPEVPSSPIEHEAAVQSVTLAEAEHPVTPVEAATVESSVVEALHEGEFEEELIDEDEYEFEPLAMHTADEEYLEDDLEEETLEGAADLGTMLRDMSIDEATQTEEEEGEEEQDEPLIEGEFEETSEDEGSSEEETEEVAAEGEAQPRRERGGRRDRRGRSGRDRDRGRDRGRGGRGPSRASMQTTNLPAISDLLKPGQEILVQIAKEPIAKKGARITSHIALPGRFLVFMPTVNHVGVSRKISSDEERRRLKQVLLSEKAEATGGFIVRTAADGASEQELRSDLRFLINLWNDIKGRSDSSKSPALIYHDLNLVERILRDQVTDNFSHIWVDSETEYERVLRFLQRFEPSLIRRVKLYSKETPLFEQFGISEEINKALRSKVWLKSGGSIVINQTEALVAIDINTGKYVGKTARLEDTIVKTNLDAIPEIVRQIRLRDLGGIIVIDFIDMDERKNRQKVLTALEEELKNDRAPSKVLQFNDFGLVAITRKRVKQSLERTLSTQCSICTGTGMVKSPVTVANEIYIEMRKMYRHIEKGDIMLRVHPEVVKQLKTNNASWLHEMEELTGKTILVKSDPSLHPEQFDIH
ncbi:Rne/Rng family ribonuclease [Terriglobus albidus]|uniref:Rne/Rng family ribonuclease n=1 Tax=Terriglobus albidus TaxID=1592106 RepID=A0A5B9E890_9BACT|nr:Rne/Rng family ribonuclease [Terriglobus albidus]QEE27804.1 Rne/Rng family ribonuclease [Terriglobus albidus]